jgi:NAD(P)-dependent dehydrogenase (short-subunit alcohol dehydrogenase family)
VTISLLTHDVMARAGVVGFSRSLASEVGGEGITVDVVTPGVTSTKAVTDSFAPEKVKQQQAQRALQRDEQPEDLVGPVLFLASPDADFMTGQTVDVDGGNYLG